MKKIALLLLVIIFVFSCKKDDNGAPVNEVDVNFIFTHYFDGDLIENSDFDLLQYFNEHGEQMSISKLVYLISDVKFTSLTTAEVFEPGDYNLIDVRNGTNLSFTPDVMIPEGEYLVSFTFGFDDEDNIDGIYQDLNSADGGWNVPAPLGGGYHYMRLEGMFTDNTSSQVGYQYHTIRANDMSTTPITLQDTSFDVSLGQITIGGNTEIEVQMDVAEWFKNPNLWDLNVLNSVLMPNFDAQIMMSENGQAINGSGGVFSLGAVNQ